MASRKRSAFGGKREPETKSVVAPALRPSRPGGGPPHLGCHSPTAAPGHPIAAHWAWVTSVFPSQNPFVKVTAIAGPSAWFLSASSTGLPIVNVPGGIQMRSRSRSAMVRGAAAAPPVESGEETFAGDGPLDSPAMSGTGRTSAARSSHKHSRRGGRIGNGNSCDGKPTGGFCRWNRASFDATFVKVDHIDHAFDLFEPVGATHGGQRFEHEGATGFGHAFLHEVAVPCRRPHVRRQERLQLELNFLVRRRFEDDFFHRRRLDPEMLAQKTVEPALVILRVARRQRPVLLHVAAFREKPREIEQPRRRVGQIRRRQAGKDGTGRAGNGTRGHYPDEPRRFWRTGKRD